MNRIYKTLRNNRTGASTAVSELQSGRTKGSSAKATALVAALSAALGALSPAGATEWNVGGTIYLSSGPTSNVNTGFAFGMTGTPAMELTDRLIADTPGNNYPYTFSFGGIESTRGVYLDLDARGALSLFDQQLGFQQTILRSAGLTVNNGATFQLTTGSIAANTNLFIQGINQGGRRVGTAQYVIEDRATTLTRKDGSRPFSSGMWWDSYAIYTGAALANIALSDTMRVAVDGNRTWGARLTGTGGIAFAGTNAAEDVVTIDTIFNSNGTNTQPFEGANTYTGGTRAENVTLNLMRGTSLGRGPLELRNSILNVNAIGAMGSGFTELTLDGSSMNWANGASDTALTVDSSEFTGTNTVTALNRLVTTGGMSVSGSLTANGTAVSASDLMLDGAKIQAGSVSVAGNTSVANTAESSVAGGLTTGSLELAQNASLTADNVTAGSVTLGEASQLNAGNFTTNNGTLTLEQGANISASSVNVGGG